MLRSSFTQTTAFLAALALTTSARSQDPLPLPLPPPAVPPAKAATPDSRLLMADRGPIHEGFAQPGASVRGKNIAARKAPPPAVDEIQPRTKPEGANVQWVPGYWHWDADRNDFIWVCGCYRNAPPDRKWEAGYWKDVKKEWTYFPGYWRPIDGKQLLANLPEPPAAKEEKLNSPNNPNAMWVPGIWEHKNGKFEWQPGYWPASSASWAWQPSQYVATENGFVFVPGYWDYSLEERGTLYMPMFFSRAQREKRGWSYRPEYPISFGSDSKWGRGGAFDALAIGPNYNSYFYGDYSSNAGQMNGGGAEYQSWDSVSPDYTNPLWQHYVRLNRSDSGFAKDTAQADAPRRGGNPFAFIEGVPNCAPPGCATVSPFASKATVGYQRVSPHGSVTTGVAQFKFAPPVYSGYGYRR